MSKPLVSVIIPVYNQANFITQTIGCVLEQTYDNLEIIVVDDGSTDQTPEILSCYKDNPRIKIIHQQNSGVETARNTGIAAITGDYVQFLDGDDWLHPQKIELQVEILENEPQYGLSYSEFYAAKSEDEIEEWDSCKRRCLGPAEGDIFDSLWLQGVFPIHTALVRREWIQKAGYFNKDLLAANEDWEYWLRIVGLGCQVHYLDFRGAYYRMHDSNNSRKEERMRTSLIKARQLIAAQFPDKVGKSTDFAIRRLLKMADDVRAWANHLEEDNKTLQALLHSYAEGNKSVADQPTTPADYIQFLESEVSRKNEHIQKLEEQFQRLDSEHSSSLEFQLKSKAVHLRTRIDKLLKRKA